MNTVAPPPRTPPSPAPLYAQVARIGKAMASPKRLELLELLAQGEKAVETLSAQAAIDMRLASAHLRALREAHLVATRREGKRVFYRLSGPDVVRLGIALRETAETHLAELRAALVAMARQPDSLFPEGRERLLERARAGEVLVIDVRPADEYAAGHLPHARSLPLDELERRLAELPAGMRIVAYCRGPFCLMSGQAVARLRAHGFDACRIDDGVGEWAAGGLPLESAAA
jgi:rhodanese-related sulfurtransferase